MLRLVITDPAGEHTFATERNEVLLGRREGVDLRIADRAASRNHCMLRVEGDTVRLVDLGTVNGTKVGGKKVNQATLGVGEAFSIGRTVIRVASFSTPLGDVAPAAGAVPVIRGTRQLRAELEPEVRGGKGARQAPVPSGGHGSDFGREVREMVRRAPWYLTSLVLHVVALMVLDLIAANPRPPGPQHTLEAISPAALAKPDELDSDDVTPDIEDVKPPEIEEEFSTEEIEDEPDRKDRAEATPSEFAPDDYRTPELGAGRGIQGTRLKRPLPLRPKIVGSEKKVNRGDLAGEHRGVADMVTRTRGGKGMPRGIPADRILVVEGDFDKMQLILDKYKVRYTLVGRDRLLRRKFPRAKLLCLNCSRRPIAPAKKKLIAIVKTFVQSGGWLITSDWAVDPYVSQGFPDKVKIVEARRHQPDTTVGVQAASATSPLLRGVFDTRMRTEWWLEETSTLVRTGPGVDVLVTSRDLKRKWGSDVVVLDFRAGRGRVLHLLGHFYQKDGNRRGLVAMDNLILNYLVERFPTNN